MNDAGLHMCPWADVLFWADRRWLEWNVDLLHLHTGERKVTRKAPHVNTGCRVHVVGFEPGHLSTNPEAVGGCCGGSSSINLAFLLGAKQVVLLGFDMREGNWHTNHKKPSAKGQHEKRFAPTLSRMAPRLAERGCDVVNATVGSALTCFPMVSFEEVLSDG